MASRVLSTERISVGLRGPLLSPARGYRYIFPAVDIRVRKTISETSGDVILIFFHGTTRLMVFAVEYEFAYYHCFFFFSSSCN